MGAIGSSQPHLTLSLTSVWIFGCLASPGSFPLGAFAILFLPPGMLLPVSACKSLNNWNLFTQEGAVLLDCSLVNKTNILFSSMIWVPISRHRCVFLDLLMWHLNLLVRRILFLFLCPLVKYFAHKALKTSHSQSSGETDKDGIQTHACRAQWISRPSP